MLLTRSEYGSGVNTFSPQGLLFQVEYAIETVKVTVVVLAAEKRATSSLLVNDSINKISKVDNHISTTFAGLIVNHARQEAQSFRLTYNSKIRVEDVTQSVANIALHFGDDDSKIRMRRPLGAAFLFGGIFIDCAAKSIGAASDGADQQFK
uniref:Proteasome alpha-type subunits domain-containing protein n=1 Tax=Ditylenchus dipsaci TaxID=166011 RepID=A0A915DEF9_9BILA